MARKTGGFKYVKPATDVAAKLRKSSARGLALASEHVLGVGNEKVPLEEGTLQRSGTTSVDEKKLRAAVSYDTPYATKQHEDMTLRHDNGREAKWLENAINSEQDAVREIIARTIRGEF